MRCRWFFTLRTGASTLGSGASSTVVTVSNISKSLCNASVWRGSRLIGALECFCRSATMRSCAASRIVSPGSMTSILQCLGKNFAELDVLSHSTCFRDEELVVSIMHHGRSGVVHIQSFCLKQFSMFGIQKH
jgi:hypothetical protein